MHSTPLQQIPDFEGRLCAMAARLLAVAFSAAESGSSAEANEAAKKLHEAARLYPRLSITTPHGGGAMRVVLELCDPSTDEVAVDMFFVEAEATPLC